MRSPEDNRARGKRCEMDVAAEPCVSGSEHINGARGKSVRHGRSPKGELRGQQRIKLRHDVTDELAAYKLAQLPFPGVFGVFYQNYRPTKNRARGKRCEIDEARRVSCGGSESTRSRRSGSTAPGRNSGSRAICNCCRRRSIG